MAEKRTLRSSSCSEAKIPCTTGSEAFSKLPNACSVTIHTSLSLSFRHLTISRATNLATEPLSLIFLRSSTLSSTVAHGANKFRTSLLILCLSNSFCKASKSNPASFPISSATKFGTLTSEPFAKQQSLTASKKSLISSFPNFSSAVATNSRHFSSSSLFSCTTYSAAKYSANGSRAKRILFLSCLSPYPIDLSSRRCFSKYSRHKIASFLPNCSKALTTASRSA